MKSLLKLEEAALFALCIYFFSMLPFAWWWFPALLLLPDIGMMGYAVNPKIGAITYNLFHHRGVAAMVAIIGLILDNDIWKLAAVIMFAHISFDRMLGYGLKFPDSFHNTHLGKIGNKKA